MKLVFVLHHHPVSFLLDMKKVVNTFDCKFYGFFNQLTWNTLISNGQYSLFDKLFVAEDHVFEDMVKAIDRIRKNTKHDSISIVTSWEADVSLCGKLNKHYGLAKDDYERFVDKVVMKDILSKSNIRLPRYVSFDKQKYLSNPNYLDEVISYIKFPMFCKPIDQNGSFGTKKIDDEQQLRKWCGECDSKYQYEIDEFIDGTMYHADSWMQGGKILHTQVAKDMHPCHDFILGNPDGSIVLKDKDPINKRIVNFSNDCLQALGLPDNGLTHLELFHTSNDELIFLETAFRPGGAWIYKMYEEYLGRDMYVDHMLLQIEPKHKISMAHNSYAAWAMYPLKEGAIIKKIPLSIDSQYIEVAKIKEGDEVTSKAAKLSDVSYLIFLKNDNYEKLMEDFKSLELYRPFLIAPRLELDSNVKKMILHSPIKENEIQKNPKVTAGVVMKNSK